MAKMLLSFAALALLSGAATAQPVKLTKAQMDQVVAGKMTDVTSQLNGGGNTPKGDANGVPIITTTNNPAGHKPPGQNGG